MTYAIISILVVCIVVSLFLEVSLNGKKIITSQYQVYNMLILILLSFMLPDIKLFYTILFLSIFYFYFLLDAIKLFHDNFDIRKTENIFIHQ